MNSNDVRHRIINGVPKSLPPFDSALVDLDKKGMLKLLLNAAPESCQIVTVSSHRTRLAKLLPLLFKKKFRLINFSLEYSNDLVYTGRVVHLFAKNKEVEPLSPIFYRGTMCLHEFSQSKGFTINLYFGGDNYSIEVHARNVESSLIFLEE